MKSTVIGFKRIETIDEWRYLHEKALEIAHFLQEVWPLEDMVITRIDSPHIDGESGIHHTRPCRAFDVRTWGLGTDRCGEIAAKVNTRWQYDPERPQIQCAVYHKTGDGAMHLHVQVHTRTRPRLSMADPPVTT